MGHTNGIAMRAVMSTTGYQGVGGRVGVTAG